MIAVLTIVLTAAVLVLLGVLIDRAWIRHRWSDELDDAYDEGYERAQRDIEAEQRARALPEAWPDGTPMVGTKELRAKLADETGPGPQRLGWTTAPDEWTADDLAGLAGASLGDEPAFDDEPDTALVPVLTEPLVIQSEVDRMCREYDRDAAAFLAELEQKAEAARAEIRALAGEL